MKHTRFTLLIFIGLLVILSGCTFFQAVTPEPLDPNAIYTQAAQTLVANLTQQAFLFTSTPEPGAQVTATPTHTQAPVNQPSATFTPTPTNTQVPPTSTSLPPTFTPTATALPCYQVGFVRDVTVPDNTIYPPKAEFVKTWELKNTGSCTWAADFDLVFASGDRMDGAVAVDLPNAVRPGETVKVSVTLRAPEKDGTYRGQWLLADSTGKKFGLGSNAATPFWVQIKVAKPNTNLAYDFAFYACVAEWRSSEGVVSCPTKLGDADGSIEVLDKLTLEGGRGEDESAIVVNPNQADNGWISGTFPAFKIKTGDRFIADVGCLDKTTGCDVKFVLEYQIGNGPISKISEWHEVNDGNITRIDVELSQLADQEVKFILTVVTNGKYENDRVFWLVPHIKRP